MRSIHIGGEERPYLFGFGAAAIFKDATGENLEGFLFRYASELAEGKDPGFLDPGLVVALVAAGLENGAELQGRPFPQSHRTVGAWMDEIGAAAWTHLLGECLLSLRPELDAATVEQKKTKKRP